MSSGGLHRSGARDPGGGQGMTAPANRVSMAFVERRDPQRPGAAAPRVSTFIVRALVEVVERCGVMREAVMAAAELDVARLHDILGGFSLPEFAALLDIALQ